MIIRPFTLFCFILSGVSGMILYTQKHKTTVLDHQIAKIIHDTEKLKSRTAMLRTEWTLLNQPDRLKTLANNFLPQLQPLSPTQFVQMSTLLNQLPPIQKELEKDPTREQIALTVATNHRQSYKTSEKPKSIIVSDNKINKLDEQDELPTQLTGSDNKDNDKTPTPPKASPKKPANLIVISKKENHPNSSNPSNKTIQKPNPIKTALFNKDKIKIKVQNNNDHDDVTQNNHPDLLKSIKKNVKPITIAKNMPSKPATIHSDFSIADSTDTSLSSAKEKSAPNPISKKDTHPVTSVSFQTKHTVATKTTHNKIQKTRYHSESAFGDDNDDSLPAPVPFSQ